MTTINPLTASPNMQPNSVASQAPKISSAELPTRDKPIPPEVGVYANGLLDISALGLEKQQKESQIDATTKPDELTDEVININSTIGRLSSVGNLSHSQATNLYNKIARLL